MYIDPQVRVYLDTLASTGELPLQAGSVEENRTSFLELTALSGEPQAVSSVESRVIAELMEKKPGIKVTYLPAMIRIDGEGKLVFKMSEISEALGRVMTPHIFEISTSTHYGRMVMVDDDTVVCFGDMTEALAYIEH